MEVTEKGRSGDLAYATIEMEGSRFGVSKYDREDHWLIDSFFRSNGFPVYVHGRGDRCCAKSIVKPEVEALLN